MVSAVASKAREPRFNLSTFQMFCSPRLWGNLTSFGQKSIQENVSLRKKITGAALPEAITDLNS